MSLLKQIARKQLFPLIISTGLEKLASYFSSKKNLILMYHGVVNRPDHDLSVNHLSTEEFKRHINYVAKNFDVVPLATLFKNYQNDSNQAERSKVAITFDDGYENNFTNAFPVLKEFNLPATIFVVSVGADKPDYVLWYDLIDIVKNQIEFPLNKEIINCFSERHQSTIHNIQSIETLKTFLKTLTPSDKQPLLDYLNKNYASLITKVNPEFKRLLNKEQLHEMVASGLIEIGSHTHHHPNLDMLSDAEVKSELEESKKILEISCRRKIQSLAFPDGAYNDRVKKIAIECGYNKLLAVNYKLEEDKNDKSILPRFCISNTTTSESNFIQIHGSFSKRGF